MSSVAVVAAEDTRKTAILLNHFKLKAKLIRLDKYTEARHVDSVLSVLQSGQHIAVVSDAGTPTIADPGHFFIHSLIQAGIRIVPIPGPCSVTTLLSASGIDVDQYYFAGFFPRKSTDATSLLHRLAQYHCPIVFFESPKRIEKTFNLLATIVPKANCIVAKELTKSFETFFRGSPADIQRQLPSTLIKGEWCFALTLPEDSTTSGSHDYWPYIHHPP